jgi:hypothetical protein
MSSSIVVQYSKKDLRPFLRDKLWLSLYTSLGHRDTAITDATALTTTVLAHLQESLQSGCVTPTTITKTASTILGRFDATAATMYKAYHPQQ